MSRVRSSDARAHPTAIAATSGRVLSKVAIAPAKPCLMSISGEPSRSSAGTRQSVKVITAVSEARMPSLCSSRSTLMPGVVLADHERLDRRAAERLVERRPDHDRVRALAGGDVDLLAVDDVLVAVLHRGGGDVGGVRPGAGLGDRHRRPGAAEALELLLVGDRRDRRVAQALARHREQQRRCRPSTSRRRRAPRRGWRRCDLAGVVGASRRGVRRPRRRRSVAPVSDTPSISAASMSSSLGYSCSARSYLREIGRSMFIASWWAWSIERRGLLLAGSPRLIIRPAPRLPSRRRPAGRGTTVRPGAP